MGFLDENLRALAKKEPSVAQELVKAQDSPRVEEGDDGSLIVSTGNGQNVVFSDCRTGQSIPRLSGYGHLKDSDVVIVYGFGIGRHIKELVQATSPKTFILVIEPGFDIFRHALKIADYTDLFNSKRLSFSISEEPYQATRVRLEKYFGVFTLKNIKVFHCPPSVRLFSGYFSRVDSCIKEISQVAKRNRDTLSRFSGVWHGHILENLPEIITSPGVDQLSGKFAGKPAVIISAGPSLDKNVKWLGLAKGKVILVCVDTALKTLLKNGIVPDFLVSLDAVEVNYRHVANEKNEDICLVANPVTFPRIIKEHKGKVFMMTFNDPLMVWIENSIGSKGNVVTGGSVATAAFNFAKKIGADPILLVGQDLAFTDQRYYTRDSYYCEKWEELLSNGSYLKDLQLSKIQQEPLAMETDYCGREIMTTSKMLGWRRWFEVMMGQGTVECVNTTEGGLTINGARDSALREALLCFRENDFQVDPVLEGVDYELDEKSIQNLLQRMRSLKNKIGKIDRVCKEGISLVKSLLINMKKKGPDSRLLQKGMARLGNIASTILSEQEFLELNKWSIDVLIEKMEEHKSKSKNGPIQASLTSYHILLMGIGDICKKLGKKLSGSTSYLEKL